MRIVRSAVDKNDIFTNSQSLWQQPGAQHAFGGALMAQCLLAAQHTIATDFLPHSMHCTFVSGASPTLQVFYHVDRTRDGNAYALRRVEGRQGERCVMEALVSFARRRVDSRRVQIKHQPVPPRLSAQDQRDGLQSQDGQNGLDQPFEVLDCPSSPSEDITQKKMRRWIRAKGSLPDPPDEPISHLAALLLMSDHRFIGVASRAHRLPRFSEPEYLRRALAVAESADADQAEVRRYVNTVAQLESRENSLRDREVGDPELQGTSVEGVVSLSHAIYFHAPEAVKADEWMMGELSSTWAAEGRGLVTQHIWGRDGALLASCYQEGIIKLKAKGIARL